MVGKIADAAADTIRTGEPVFLIDIDIDRFKQINDAIGYSHGDELVCAFTSRLKGSMPKDAVIGRIGAGEFGVLLPDRDVRGSIERLIEKLINEMMEPYQLQTHLQSVSLVGRHRGDAEGRRRPGPGLAPFESCVAERAGQRRRQLVCVPCGHGPRGRLSATGSSRS
ncbi:GGDEF domain-containing protein [Mesorhizobium atlanticum]